MARKRSELGFFSKKESINHVFKKAVDWTPQPIPKLTTKLLNIVRIQHG
jgi:hypothetical protein